MFWGSYEGAETRMIRELLRGSTTVVELGSSLGVTTVHVAALMAPGGRLLCVEANPSLLPGLRDRLARHTVSLHVDSSTLRSPIPAGRSFSTYPRRLKLEPGVAGCRRALPAGLSGRRVRVPASTLREILRRAEVDEFDLICDIEGAEAAFLLKDPDVLRRCRRAVIELHATPSMAGPCRCLISRRWRRPRGCGWSAVMGRSSAWSAHDTVPKAWRAASLVVRANSVDPNLAERSAPACCIAPSSAGLSSRRSSCPASMAGSPDR